jgi:predicted MFS family arabinose efflux permease
MAVSPNALIFFIASLVLGLAAVVTQVIIAYAAVLSSPESRGRVIGIVTSGVVIGILLARTVSGILADPFGWRSVYIVSAVLMVAIALVLARRLPPELAGRNAVSYRRLITSVVTLTVQDRVFRVRGLITLFMFAGFGALWGSIALPLSAEPWHMSTTEIGLFGLAGAAGAFGAARAGALADRGLAQWVSGITLVLFAVSWALIGFLPHSLIPLIIGILVIDLAGQAIHVTNQQLIVAIDPNSSSRLIGSNMVFFALGTGGGALAATVTHDGFGWIGVCVLGAAFSVIALMIWAVDRLTTPRIEPGPAASQIDAEPARSGRPEDVPTT